MKDFGKDLFSMADDFFENITETLKEEVSESMAEYEVNKKRPSITTLDYTRVSADRGEELKGAKVGFFKNGFKKKLAESIIEGKTEFAEVLVLARAKKVIDRSEKTRNVTYRYFYKIADLKGTVIRCDLPYLDDENPLNFRYYGGNSDSETGNVDVVDPENYRHMFVLHYCLGDDQNYVLLTREQLSDLEILADNVPFGGYDHALGDGVGHKW